VTRRYFQPAYLPGRATWCGVTTAPHTTYRHGNRATDMTPVRLRPWERISCTPSIVGRPLILVCFTRRCLRAAAPTITCLPHFAAPHSSPTYRYRKRRFFCKHDSGDASLAGKTKTSAARSTYSTCGAFAGTSRLQPPLPRLSLLLSPPPTTFRRSAARTVFWVLPERVTPSCQHEHAA